MSSWWGEEKLETKATLFQMGRRSGPRGMAAQCEHKNQTERLPFQFFRPSHQLIAEIEDRPPVSSLNQASAHSSDECSFQ